MVGRQLFPFEMAPFLGDIRSFSGVYIQVCTQVGDIFISPKSIVNHPQ